jgi:hypothetical protein
MVIALMGNAAQSDSRMRKAKAINRRAQDNFAERDKTFIHWHPLGASGLIEFVDGAGDRLVVHSGLEQGNHSDSLLIHADNRWENWGILWQSIALG